MKLLLPLIILPGLFYLAAANQHMHSAGLQQTPNPDTTRPDTVLTTVQVQSSYPGGPAGWARFLNEKLPQYYTGNVVKQGIQGRTVVEFIVDKKGNVSNIKGIEGPEELQKIAVKMISKSGKWIPAVDHGEKVTSYRRLPITFVLQ